MGPLRPRHPTTDALFSSSTQRVLGLLFGQPDRRFSITELIALAAIGSGTVQRELRRLVAGGLVTIHPVKGRKLCQANLSAVGFEELRCLIGKTIGIPAQMRAVLASVARRIQFAVLYSTQPKGTGEPLSELGVLIVSDELGLQEVGRLLSTVELWLNRSIGRTVFTSAEFLERRRRQLRFPTEMLAGEHEVLLGREGMIGRD